MYHTITEFIKDWRLESRRTQKVLDALTDASLSQRVAEEGRSIKVLAWHIVITVGEMMTHAGMKIDAIKEDAPAPNIAKEIGSAYSTESMKLSKALPEQWTDGMLADSIKLYGRDWIRRDVLDSLIRHQIHHRAQLTVLMRQAGLKVPGVYGPSREEWSTFGMQPPKEG
jgi:uncharacterized damage-inducible protein DinB